MPHTAVSGAGEIMLFGVRVVVDSMRKSVSMNNLSQYEHPHDAVNNKEDAGYASADDAPAPVPAKHNDRERKRGIPWTEDEHKLFLLGLQKVGKGDWKGISKNFVKTRTPTQVASHAQKYFLRRTNLTRRRRRSSLFDITNETVSATPMEEEKIQHQDNMPHSRPMYPTNATETPESSRFSMVPMYSMGVGSGVNSVLAGNQMEKLTLGQEIVEQNGGSKLACSILVVPDHNASSRVSDINSNTSSIVDPPKLSLGLSMSSDQRQTSPRHSALHAMPCFNNGDSIITVA